MWRCGEGGGAFDRIAAAVDMVGVIAKLVLADAVREDRLPDSGDYVATAMDVVVLS